MFGGCCGWGKMVEGEPHQGMYPVVADNHKNSSIPAFLCPTHGTPPPRAATSGVALTPHPPYGYAPVFLQAAPALLLSRAVLLLNTSSGLHGTRNQPPGISTIRVRQPPRAQRAAPIDPTKFVRIPKNMDMGRIPKRATVGPYSRSLLVFLFLKRERVNCSLVKKNSLVNLSSGQVKIVRFGDSDEASENKDSC